VSGAFVLRVEHLGVQPIGSKKSRGETGKPANVLSMASPTMTVTCPHCEAEIELRIETQAAIAPRFELPFATVAEFAEWLKASRLSVEEFKRLPVYEWHRDQLEPLMRALADDAGDETAEWHRDQLEPLTRAAADRAEDEQANAADR
jgi:hypothetical protein